MIRQKKYAEAHDLRAEIESMEINEQAKHMDTREKKLAKAMEKVIARQIVERNSLAKKLSY